MLEFQNSDSIFVMERLLTTQEISNYLQVSPRTVESWVSRGKIPFLKVGKLTRFDINIIQKWLYSKAGGSMDYSSIVRD